MQLSDRGLKMLCSFEGFVPHVYEDQGRYLTIGYGHKLTHEEIVKGTYHNKSLTREEGMALCRKDLARFEVAVNDMVRVPISQAQYDALISFSFNVGTEALAGSTLLIKLNKGDYVGAAAEFVRWDRVKGHEDLGLKGRREGEARLFLEGMPSVGGPTLDDVLRLAEAQQFPAMDIFDPADDRHPSPDPLDGSVPVPSDEPTRPDVALPAKDES